MSEPCGERFFQNRQCRFFPCHQGLEPESFNCLFCFCPLYHDRECGGAYTLTGKGAKNCVRCTFPHVARNYDAVIQKIRRINTRFLTPYDARL